MTGTGTVIRVLPRIGAGWTTPAGRISALLLEALEEPQPGPLWICRPALRAWGRIGARARAEQARPGYPAGPCPRLCLLPVDPDDLVALGAAAAALGAGLLPGADPRMAAVSARAAAGCGTDPVTPVRELARMHGTLDLDHGPDAELLYVLAGVAVDDEAVRAARDRIAVRVTTMWAAGADRPAPHRVGPPAAA